MLLYFSHNCQSGPQLNDWRHRTRSLFLSSGSEYKILANKMVYYIYEFAF